MLTGDLSFCKDASSGAWIDPLLGGEFGAVSLQVPNCFPAYARICHPAKDVDGLPVDWVTVASATGRTPHALMQWHALVGSPDPFNFTGSLWPGQEPDLGNLESDQLIALCDVLNAHSADVSRCFVGIWVGWGWAGLAGSHEQLRRPGREYFLLEGPLSAAGDVANEGWNTHSPNLLWPEDRTWFVASEIDFDSTLVGGTEDLIGAILGTPGLDAWPVGPTDSLAHDADKINHVPPWSRPSQSEA